MTPRKEPKKCREWEKIRRDKLNIAFSVLSKLLPNHDPSLTWSKVDILQRASNYIEEMQVNLKNVLTTEGVNKTKRCEIKILYGRVKKLLLRNEQLSNLLKEAGIKIPSVYGSVKNFKEPLRWSNKITQEQAKELQKEEIRKENGEIKTVKKKRNLKKSTTVANKHQRKVNRKIKIAANKNPVISLQLSNVVPLANHQTLPKVSSQPCFIITNKPSLNLPLGLQQNLKTKASTVVTNSKSLTTPKVASIVKPSQTATVIPKVATQTLNTLGPGTLILANGNIVPILPSSTVIPPPTILTNPTPIILKPPPTNTTLIVMPPSTCINQTTKPVTTTTTNNVPIHPRIRPKINITCTTQSNKVPIPAISRFKDMNTEKVVQKKKEVENKINKKKIKRKGVNNQLPNKKSKPTTVIKPQPTLADENKENAVKNPGLSVSESENIEKDSALNKEEVPAEVPVIETVAEDKIDAKVSPTETISENQAPVSVVETMTTVNEVQDSLPNNTSKEHTQPVETPAKSQEQDKINISPPTTTSSELTVNLNHSELSNDIFSTLQVPIGGQNPESTSPTAAFLLAFPLVSSLTGVKVTEVIEEENSDSRHGTPTLLQIGTMETTKTTQSVHVESLTPNLLNLDNFSFFSGNNFYPSFDSGPVIDSVKTSSACAKVSEVPTKIVEAVITSSQVTSANPPLYATEPTVVSKPIMSVVSNPFPQQNSVISYSKPSLPPPLVTSTYLQNTVPTNNCSSATRKPTDMQYNPVSIAQCNAFNPFSDFSKPNSYPSFSKSYSDPLYTNSNYNYHHNDSNFNQNVYYPSKSAKPNNPYNTTNYPETTYNISDSRKRHMPYYNQNKTQTKPNTKSAKTNSHPKPPINWMTTPDFRSQPSGGDYLVPPIDYNPNTFYTSSSTHTTYFNTTSSMYPGAEFQNSIGDNRKAFDSSLPILPTNTSQRNEFEENQFSWSPTKLPQFLETPHTFVSSTLPTLVGDLALGTAQAQFNEQKVEQSKTKESSRRSKVHSVTYDNQSNFLSVSQLVENKTDASSSRTTNRRNSGNRNVKSNSQKKTAKPVENKELLDVGTLTMDKKQNLNYGMSHVENSWMNDCNKPNRQTHKNAQSSYSAEALIGHQDHTDTLLPKQRYRQQATYPTTSKALPIPTFLSDNIVPYFPPVEIPQDNNFMQSNANYQSFNTSVQNNSYVSGGPTITSSYLQPSGLIPEFQNYPPMIPDEKLDTKHCNRNDSIKQASTTNRTEDRLNIAQVNSDCASATNNFAKKSKNKQSNEPNLPGIVDFGFLSMPNTINSPILPDDFHTHSNFLPPPNPSQLYPCKNPLYGKQSSELLPLPPVTRSGTQNFDAPSSVTGNVGSSLTSFNLSAIFPEINKGSMPLPGLYPDPPKNKNYNFQRNYIGSSVQVFKSTSSTSYVNSLSTSYAPSN